MKSNTRHRKKSRRQRSRFKSIFGVQLQVNFPESLRKGALDEKLNEHCYIIPGLGDAGNLAYGAKL